MATRTASALYAPVFAGSEGWSPANFVRKLLSGLKILRDSFVEARAMAYKAERRHKFIAE